VDFTYPVAKDWSLAPLRNDVNMIACGICQNNTGNHGCVQTRRCTIVLDSADGKSSYVAAK